MLCGAAGAVAVLGGPARMQPELRRAWLSVLTSRDLTARSTPLAAELLRRAMQGHLIRPACELLDLASDDRWRSGVDELHAVGASSGRGHALAIGAAALLLGGGSAKGGRT